MTRNTAIKTGAVGAACLAIGAGGGILGSAGAQDAAGHHGHHGHHQHHHRGGSAKLARAVHADAVVPTKAGFKTITLDRGFLTARDGTKLTLRQGTREKTWRTQTFTVPADAKVRRERRPATLADLKTGDVVRILTLPKRTVVLAHPLRAHAAR